MHTFLSVLGCLAEGEGEEEGYGDLVRLNWVLLFPTIYFLEIIRQSMEKELGMGAISALCKEMNSKSHWMTSIHICKQTQRRQVAPMSCTAESTMAA